jgi:hypothetical protein
VFRPCQKLVKSRKVMLIFLVVTILFVLTSTSTFEGLELNYVNAKNISNSSISINITNSTGDEKDMSRNSTVIDTETSLPPESDETGSIASLPGKCLGSALCPD